MLGTEHSWCVTMRNILLQFNDMGHKLYLKSTDGENLIPKKLKSRLNRDIEVPDLDVCYTLPSNFKIRFKEKSKVKMAIYNYETDIFPEMWKKDIKYVDYVLPSSSFSKDIFTKGGWPEEKCKIIPHGINPAEFENLSIFPLKTNKSFKFLNISIPHYRKNIPLLLEAYYSTFSNEDDVCLVLKTKIQEPKQRFEIDLKKEIIKLQEKYFHKKGGLPQIEIIQNRLESLIPLYRSCQVLINVSSSEGFGLPLLEGMAANNLIIAPKCSGQLDFLNEKNCLFLDVKEINASPQYQYWKSSDLAKTYITNIDSISSAMLNSFQNYHSLKESFAAESQKTILNFTWKNAASKILELL